MALNVSAIPPKPINSPHNIFNCIVEIPKGSTQKYEYNFEYDVFELDRTLPSSLYYPMSYGFIPNTLAEDGDALDVCIYSIHPIDRETLVQVKIVGALWMKDAGEMDYKLIGVPHFHPKIETFGNITDLDPTSLEITKTFFKIYKQNTKKHDQVEVGDWLWHDETLLIIQKAIDKQVNYSNLQH